MNQNAKLILSAITAFGIAAGGAIIVVVGAGNSLNQSVYVLASIVGVVSAAKDVRSFLQIPPIEIDNNNIPKPPK